MNIELLDHFPPELDDIALESPSSSFYQTSCWIESIRSTFSHMDFQCLVARSGSLVAGYFPFFRVRKAPVVLLRSMPFGTYGGPVVKQDGRIFSSLIEAYSRLLRGTRVVAIEWVDFWNRGEKSGFSREEGSTQTIDLTQGFDKIWSERFGKAKRRQARRAEREGLSVVEATTADQVKAYFTIYEERMKMWGEKFIYPEAFFLELMERGRGSVKLFLICRDDMMLGGHLNFYYKDTVTAWNGVTREDSKSRQASTFLYSWLIQHACDNGFKLYNLGGSLGKSSLVQYKTSLGGRLYRYSIYRKVTPAGLIARSVARLLFWR